MRPPAAFRTSRALAWLVAGLVVAATPPVAGAAGRKAALDRCHTAGEFRILYALSESADSLPQEARKDGNANDVPDLIEDIALQLVTARAIYADVMGLRHPFQSPRYGGKPGRINVYVMDLKGKNGCAYDEMSFSRRPDGGEEGHALIMDISRRIRGDNLTPAHELFHLFQYGYTMFKNGWYTEGTARWSEEAFRGETYKAGVVPSGREQVEALFKETYGAIGFWKRVCRDVDPGGAEVPGSVRAARYPGSGGAIVTAERVRGAAFIRAMLEGLDALDDGVSRENGWEPHRWREEDQVNPVNNERIWSAVMKVRATLAKGPAGAKGK